MLPVLAISGSVEQRALFIQELSKAFQDKQQYIAVVQAKNHSENTSGSLLVSGHDWTLNLPNMACPPSKYELNRLPLYLPLHVDLIVVDDHQLDSIPQLHLKTVQQHSGEKSVHLCGTYIPPKTAQGTETAADHQFTDMETCVQFLLTSTADHHLLPEFVLWINNRRIGCKDFVRDFFIKAITGMISSLKKVDRSGKVHLWFEMKQ
ncbi:hypothetical protein ACFL27_10860 [candidate division CSSED10-310 bacterium]|uniref:MobA-like NTP transferase domain-containing protein n=1 Tax=candidate division CSSED10-310 bacterium TaxID=2855610 RepID=A0ABV6YX71_UNCC1